MEERKQSLEWAEAQKIVISTDLVAATKQQLQFLEAVDRIPNLHDGPLLHRAIFRYKKCWLPLLAKHTQSESSECDLVVPLDCEWIWHCHRLNPVRYMSDCKELFGRVLDTTCVMSSVQQGACRKESEAKWKNMYPNESYELDYNNDHWNNDAADNDLEAGLMMSTNYDLVSAVKRQTPFYHQVSRSFMKSDEFLEGAVQRYKGFLHLIWKNLKSKSKRFCVPTYDIDLIWHAHQLQPLDYSKDVRAILGKVLGHDDTDSDRTKGQKLDVGFLRTTQQWEETYGTGYWRAGAMYRGTAPDDHPKTCQTKNSTKITVVEVLLEILGERNLCAANHSSLLVCVSKKEPDMVFKSKKVISICCGGEKQAAAFQCEPWGELLLELISYSPSDQPQKVLLGTTSFSLLELQESVSKLPGKQSLEFRSAGSTRNMNAPEEPVGLCYISVSITPPISLNPYEVPTVNQRAGAGSECIEFCQLTKPTHDHFCGLVNGGGRCVDFSGLAHQAGMCGGCSGGGGGCAGSCGTPCHSSCSSCSGR